MAGSHSAEFNDGWENLKRAFHAVMEDASNHRISLVDKFTESLFFVDRTKDHLVLTLFADVLDWGSLHIETRSHRWSFHPAVSNALSRDEFLVEVWVGFRFL